MKDAIQKAVTLTEAAGYVKQFKGKIIVIKYGGNAMGSDAQADPVLADIARLAELGLKVVVVHGGGPKIDEEMSKQGIKKKVIDGLRVTNAAGIKVVAKVLGDINKQCVEGLGKAGAAAEDCTDNMFKTEINDQRLGYVGEIVNVNRALLLEKLKAGIIPVVSSLGKDAEGNLTNINADTAATMLAIALKAEKLTILTNVDGVITSKKNLITHLGVHEVEYYIQSNMIHGGMIPKVRACAEAVRQGVKKAHLINGMVPGALLAEIFTDKGIGTEIVK